jgi:hypothetical protein
MIGSTRLGVSFNVGILLELAVQLLQQIEASGEYVNEALALIIPKLSLRQEKLYVVKNDCKASHSELRISKLLESGGKRLLRPQST